MARQGEEGEKGVAEVENRRKEGLGKERENGRERRDAVSRGRGPELKSADRFRSSEEGSNGDDEGSTTVVVEIWVVRTGDGERDEEKSLPRGNETGFNE